MRSPDLPKAVLLSPTPTYGGKVRDRSARTGLRPGDMRDSRRPQRVGRNDQVAGRQFSRCSRGFHASNSVLGRCGAWREGMDCRRYRVLPVIVDCRCRMTRMRWGTQRRRRERGVLPLSAWHDCG